MAAISSRHLLHALLHQATDNLNGVWCRTQEARLSEWSEWDMDAWVWTVPKEHSKGGEKIVRPVPDAMRKFIEILHDEKRNYPAFCLGRLKAVKR